MQGQSSARVVCQHMLLVIDQKLDLIFLSPFQLRMFYDSMRFHRTELLSMYRQMIVLLSMVSMDI